MAEKKKLLAEAGTDKIKVILGWLFNFRRLTVYLCKIKDVLVANKKLHRTRCYNWQNGPCRVYHFPNLSFYEQVERPNVEVAQQKDN